MIAIIGGIFDSLFILFGITILLTLGVTPPLNLTIIYLVIVAVTIAVIVLTNKS